MSRWYLETFTRDLCQEKEISHTRIGFWNCYVNSFWTFKPRKLTSTCYLKWKVRTTLSYINTVYTPKQFTFSLERWIILWTKTVRLRDSMYSFCVASREVRPWCAFDGTMEDATHLCIMLDECHGRNEWQSSVEELLAYEQDLVTVSLIKCSLYQSITVTSSFGPALRFSYRFHNVAHPYSFGARRIQLF